MQTLLISYELADPAHEAAVSQFIESFGDALRFAAGTYAVETDLRADQVFTRLEPLLGRDDVAYVMTLGEPWIGYGYEAMNDWLRRHLH